MAGTLYQYPGGFSQMQIAVDYYLDSSKEIAIIGKRNDAATKEVLSYFRSEFMPNKVIAFAEPDQTEAIPLTDKRVMKSDKTTIYVCEDQICKFPTNDLKVVKKQLGEIKKYSLK